MRRSVTESAPSVDAIENEWRAGAGDAFPCEHAQRVESASVCSAVHQRPYGLSTPPSRKTRRVCMPSIPKNARQIGSRAHARDPAMPPSELTGDTCTRSRSSRCRSSGLVPIDRVKTRTTNRRSADMRSFHRHLRGVEAGRIWCSVIHGNRTGASEQFRQHHLGMMRAVHADDDVPAARELLTERGCSRTSRSDRPVANMMTGARAEPSVNGTPATLCVRTRACSAVHSLTAASR